MCRTLNADTEFHGASLRAGEKMMLLFESANFDESVFPNPDQFQTDRIPTATSPSASELTSVWAISWPDSS